MQSQPTAKACGLRNHGEAFRQFRTAGLLAGAHEFAIGVLSHKLAGVVIACMGVAGLAGAALTFWPK
jgi:hypothetical protein